MHILTGNGDVPHREWGCASPRMGKCLTVNRDVPHRECTSSPGMHILTGNAHSLYMVVSFYKKHFGSQMKNAVSYQRELGVFEGSWVSN